jgi:hypothetical protein
MLGDPFAFLTLTVILALGCLTVVALRDVTTKKAFIYAPSGSFANLPSKNWKIGFSVGCAVLLSLIAAGIVRYGRFLAAKKDAPVAQAPTTHTEPMVPLNPIPSGIHQPPKMEHPIGAKSNKPALPAAPQFAAPAAASGGGAVSSPPSQLDLLSQTNKNLSKSDRDRLANAFFDYSQLLNDGNTVWGKANLEGGQLRNAWQRGSITRDFDSHQKTLHEILVAAQDYAKEFRRVRAKWEYYPAQTDYIFGPEPENISINLLEGAVHAYADYLDRWAEIQNKDEKQISFLFEPEQNSYEDAMTRFAHWRQDCDRRLVQMKQSIQ